MKDFFNLEDMKDLKTLQEERDSEQQQNYESQVGARKLNENPSTLPE